MRGNVIVADLALWLRGEISAQHWTPKRLATELGVARPTASKWLNGRAVPEPAKCQDIAALFEISTLRVLAMAGHLRPVESPEPETPAESQRRHWLLRFRDLVADVDAQPNTVQAVVVESVLDQLSVLLSRLKHRE